MAAQVSKIEELLQENETLPESLLIADELSVTCSNTYTNYPKGLYITYFKNGFFYVEHDDCVTMYNVNDIREIAMFFHRSRKRP